MPQETQKQATARIQKTNENVNFHKVKNLIIS